MQFLRCSLVLLFLLLPASAQSKRPMTYADTDAWRSISAQKISPDGKYAGFALFPQDGDGEVAIVDVATKKTRVFPAGMRPAPPPPDPDAEGPPVQRTVNLSFSADSQWAIFTTFPTKAEAKANQKKKETERSKGGLVVLHLSDSAMLNFPNIKSYVLPTESNKFFVFLHDNPEKQLVIQPLGEGTARTIGGVSDYTVARNGGHVVYATEEGVFAINGEDLQSNPLALVSGKGKYGRFAYDEKQSLLAFASESTIYTWDRKPVAAKAFGVQIAPRGNLSFSADAERLFYPIAARAAAKAQPRNEDEAVYDLWHWKDDHTQTMQRVRAASERNRTYRGMLTLANGGSRQLSDESMRDISISETGLYAIGSDDRAYRPVAEYDTRYNDQYLVNTLTGQRRLLGKQRAGGYGWSPDGRYATRFDSKDWHCLNIATGVEVNLTQGLGVNFYNEDYDSPGRPSSYAGALWTSDGKWILLVDRYDVWQISPDGRIAKNLSDGVGRREKVQLRVQATETGERNKGIDAAKPLLLRGASLVDRKSGYYSDYVDGTAEPRLLAKDGKTFGPPLKAKNADVYLLTIGNFQQYPDLYVTNSEMKDFVKLSDANPQLANFHWGSAELMNFHSNEGQALQAALYKPEGFDPKKKYPLMVYIYERLSQNVNNFTEPTPRNSINIPIYVSNGYVVLTPDIAYKLGYPGESAMNCVLPAIQKLIDQGFIDPERIGIQGHSWGGYQIAYMVTRTKLFRAAAPGAVVANMFSAYNGIRYGPGIPRQFQYERTQSRIGGTPWEYPLRFLENSPVFRADSITTPLLMMHNDADDAVPYTQGLELFLSLRRLGKEAYLFNYNGEPHNLRKRPNQMHYATKMLEFFDHYLKGAPRPEWMEKGRPFLEKEPAPRGASTAASDQP
ncbi:MAG: prolyl oligopeptidase family serine peptidase [Bryobacter sp.]|nr:prolyl oligopeptidase family serine peptidase [Bryobacter sp.]